MSPELNCDEAQALIVDRSSEVNLSPDTLRELDTHLAGCEDCRGFVVELAQLDDRIAETLRENPDYVSPEGARVAARVMATIKAAEGPAAVAGESAARERGGWGSPWGALVAAAALCAVVLGLGWGISPGSSGDLHAAGVKVEELKAQRDEARAQAEKFKRDLETAQARIKELEKKPREPKDD